MNFSSIKIPLAVLLVSGVMLGRAAEAQNGNARQSERVESTAAVNFVKLKQAVIESELAFAATMKSRDHAALARFVAPDAVFFTDTAVLRGREAILKGWAQYYESAQAPFSWAPDQVEVFPDGNLAYSGGTISDPSGKPIGRFSSIWRLKHNGQWEVIFDRGEPLPSTTAR